MRAVLPILLSVATVSTGSACLAAPQLVEDSHFVLVGKEAVLAGPAEAISGAMVRQAKWSPDSRYILAQRTWMQLPPQPGNTRPFEQTLVLWNAETRHTAELLKTRGAGDDQSEVGWLGAPDVALALMDYQPPATTLRNPAAPDAAPQRWVLRVDARRGTVRPLFQTEKYARLITAPMQQSAVIMSPQERTLRFVRADGTFRVTAQLAPEMVVADAHWRRDGAVLIVSALMPDPKEKGSVKQYSLAVEPSTGAVTPLTEAPPTYHEEVGSEHFHLQRGNPAAVSQEMTQHRINPLWLVGDPGSPLTLIAPDSESGSLAPNGSGVLYVADGALWERPLVRVPQEQFAAAREAARRTTYMSNAKQIGLGLIIYAQDHNETLPGATEVLSDLLAPNISDQILDGFIYTYAGGKIADIQATSETVLGYTPMPGGRINLYADGHVSWEAEPKK